MYEKDNLWQNLYLIYFILLGFQASKIGGLKPSQIYLVLFFLFLVIQNIQQKTFNFTIIFVLVISGIVMSLISLNSTAYKIKEINFIIKYIFMFPATFYIGYKLISMVDIKNIPKLFEKTLLVYISIASIIYFIPIPQNILEKFVHYRSGAYGYRYLDFQGTFVESGILAFSLGVFLIASISFRVDNAVKIESKKWYIVFLIVSLIAIILSQNKTIILSYLMILLFFIFYKGYITLSRTNYHTNFLENDEDKTIRMLSKLNSFKLLLTILFITTTFFIANELLPTPIITKDLIVLKLTHERGKAFEYAMNFLEQTNYIGGYGFGFIEGYFTTYKMDIIGLGEGVGMIFNSYFDIWLSVTLFGLIYYITIQYYSFSSKSFFTIVVPLYMLIFINFNPVGATEEFFLFSGISSGLAARLSKEDSL